MNSDNNTAPGLIMLAMFLGGIFLLAEYYIPPQDGTPLSHTRSNAPEIQPERNAFEDIAIAAESAYVLDTTTGNILFSKQEEAQLPLASITKVMSALVAEEVLSPKTSVAVDEQDIETDGDTGLLVGEYWHFTDLLEFSLVASSNDGMSAIAGVAGSELAKTKAGKWKRDPEDAFVAAMNAKADALGLQQTFFLNPTGLDVNKRVSGAYGSARDVARLFEHVLTNNGAALRGTRQPSVSFSSDTQIHTATNTNAALGAIPGLIGGKTGFTDLGGGNLAVAFNVGLGKPVIAVVLGSSYEERFSDIATLVRATYSYYNTIE